MVNLLKTKYLIITEYYLTEEIIFVENDSLFFNLVIAFYV